MTRLSKMKNSTKILTFFLLLCPLKQAMAQSGCDSVWVGGCKNKPMDKVAEVMKRLWNEELSESVWTGNSYYPFAIESVTINPKTVQIRYRYTRTPEHWVAQDNKKILTLPGIVSVTYGMGPKNDELTGVPNMGAALLDQTTRSDDMVLIKNTTAVSEDYLYGKYPAKIFQIALHTAFKSSDKNLKGKGIRISKNYSDQVQGYDRKKVDDYFVVTTAMSNGKSLAIKYSRDGQVLSKQALDGEAFPYEGVSSVSDTHFRTYKFDSGLNDFSLQREDVLDQQDFTLVDRESRSTRYAIDPRIMSIKGAESLADSYNSVFYGYSNDHGNIVVRSLSAYTNDKGGCGSQGCVSVEGEFWSGITYFRDSIYDVDLSGKRVLVTTSADQHITFHQENFEWADGTRESHQIEFRDLGLNGSHYDNFSSVWNGDYVFTSGTYLPYGTNKISYFVMKTDGLGNVFWVYTPSSTANPVEIFSLAVDSQKNTVVVGRTLEADGQHFDAYAATIDSRGQLVKTLNWGITGGDEEFQSVLYDSSSNAFFVTGQRPELVNYDEPIAGSSVVLFQRLSPVDLKNELGPEDGN